MGEFFGSAQGAEAGGEILQGLGVEIEIGVIGEEGTVNRAVLETREDFAGLRQLLRGGGVIGGEQQRSDGVGDGAGSVGGILIGQNDYGDTFVGIDDVFAGEAGNFATVR